MPGGTGRHFGAVVSDGSLRVRPGTTHLRQTAPGKLRLGFVPLLDAAPLIAAEAQGFFADEGLRVSLERQIGWGNVRDKLSYGQLHASHALFGMPIASALGTERYTEPLVAIAGLGSGGNAITLATRLTDAGVTTAAGLRTFTRTDGSRRAVLAHVFGCSVHHYLLRDWLVAGGLDPDQDVRLIVLPPQQMDRQLEAGTIDGFCVGDPWNTFAEAAGFGRVVATGAKLMPGHPDKVLAVTERWLADNGPVAVALVRATLRGLAFCRDDANRSLLVETLARPEYLDVPPDLLDRSLSRPDLRHAADPARPTVERATWLLDQMARWGHVPRMSRPELTAIATAAVDDRPYRLATAANFDFATDRPLTLTTAAKE